MVDVNLIPVYFILKFYAVYFSDHQVQRDVPKVITFDMKECSKRCGTVIYVWGLHARAQLSMISLCPLIDLDHRKYH